jgi:hypothetical protein
MRRSILESGAALLSVATLGATATLLAGPAHASVTLPVFNAPGIPQAGFPDFSNSNDVSLVFSRVLFGGDYLLTATGSAGVFNLNSTQSYSVSNEFFGMYAEFNSKGQFISGGETIIGSIPGLTGNRFQNLYSVAFDKYAVSTSTPGLGFQSLFPTASGFASKYQSGDESLYLYSSALASLDNALASGKNLPNFFTATVSEFTTVPLPAAGWLLGAGLLGLIAIGRPRRLFHEDRKDSLEEAAPQVGLNASSADSSAQKKPRRKALRARDRNATSEYGWYGGYSTWPGELA